MNIPFREFPFSYRLSQSGIGFVLVAMAISGPILRLVPQAARVFVLGLFAAIVLGSLLISNYVIVKYPFISLVDADDGDPFSNHYKSHGSWLYRTLKIVGLLVPVAVGLGIYFAGANTMLKQVALGYCIVQASFMLFFTIWYCPIRHPTVATFVRSTLGVGIVLFPLYAISILIGALRCNQLLESLRE